MRAYLVDDERLDYEDVEAMVDAAES